MKTKTTKQEIEHLTVEELRSLLVKLTNDLQLVRDALTEHAGYCLRIDEVRRPKHSVTVHERALELADDRAQRRPTLSYIKKQ